MISREKKHFLKRVAQVLFLPALVTMLPVETSASHCWNLVNREGEVSSAESVDNGQFLEQGNNLHWIAGYVNGVWTTLRPERVRSILFSRWGTTTANIEGGCVGVVTTHEGDTGTIEVPETITYYAKTSLMTRSLGCRDIRLVARCGNVPAAVLDKAIESLVLLTTPELDREARTQKERAIRLILDEDRGVENAEILFKGAGATSRD